ncbi:alpha/beta hydrolase family protein [Dyella caseinilytica]|uniref:S9 family peptidase n=1 Tax=Dyella caseinilytica TaxID=1849581 RepID=A0ABX7GSH5_9GAMM|nr:S9 family peptidase [Dyella caseinilytica]QRN52938.1 S9 family peptidase [Dyella caseinilytica]GGA10027.1 peptidase S9 [Dyella caseinilytica]
MDRRKWGLTAVLVSSLLAAHAGLAADAYADTVAHGPVPIADFIRQPDFSKVTISPDGHYLATLVPQPDNPYGNLICIVDVGTGKILHVLRSGRSMLVSDYLWASDSRIIATVAIQYGGLDTPTPTGELFAINADGSDAIDLFGYRAGSMQTGSMIPVLQRRDAYAEPLGVDPVAENKILIATNDFTLSREGSYTSAEVLDVRNGRTVSQGASPVRNAKLIADHAGLVRVAYADNDYAGDVVWLRASANDAWTVLNDPAKTGIEFVPIGFNRDNSKLYVRVAHGDRPDAIELLDIASNTFRRLYQGAFANPGTLLPTADGLDYYAVITQDGQQKLFYLDDDSLEARLSKALAANFPGQLAYFSSFTRDGKHAVVTVVSDRNPGDYYLFDLGTHNARHLFSAMPWIDPKQMRPMQPIAFTTRDDLLLHGFLTLPAGHPPFPMIVLPHGGPHGIADEWRFDPEVQLFANRGYAVLQINYRGSGGYGSNFISRGFRQWGLSMQDDLTDATKWAIQQGYADAKRICIYGASYGGYAALEGAVREPDLYRCAIGYDGVYDLRVQLSRSDTEQTDRGDAYLKLALGSDPDDLLRRSPLSGVSRIKADILLIHGGEDPRAPFKNFQELVKALQQSGKHVETLVEPAEGHGFFLPQHKEEAYEKIVEFIDRHIGSNTMTSSNQGSPDTSP